MTSINIKGREIRTIIIKDSFHRRAIQFSNNIIKLLGKIGVKDDDIDIPIEVVANKRMPAQVSWYFDGQYMHYSNGSQQKFVENLHLIQSVLEAEINALMNEEQTVEEFISKFREEKDIAEKRKEAREILGLKPDEKDVAVIDKAYKDLAKEHHPDREGGDTAKFKEINNAHKMLKRELQ
jgi:hypothetical protein